MDENTPSSAPDAVRAAIRQKHAELLSRRDRMLATRDEIDRGLRRIEGELVHLVETAKIFGDTLETPKSAGLATPNLLRLFYTHPSSPKPDAHQVAAAPTGAPPPGPVPKIKQIVLDRLQAAGERGARAADIRQFIATTYGIETHEKTVGMQLYRYLKAGVARREGATWFFVRPPVPKKNPGVGAPGSNDVFE